MSQQTVTVDVRDDIRNGREPFSKIMSAVAALRPDEALRLVAPFEPVPLFGILEKQGFECHAEQNEAGDWEVLFTRQAGGAGSGRNTNARPAQGPNAPCPVAEGTVSKVDARGLEPPQPMIKILEAVSSLPVGATLQARTDRRPMHLYPQLEERGFTAETEEQSDGSFITCIRRR
jgi:uncharacterized protein (DUF2249 family)